MSAGDGVLTSVIDLIFGLDNYDAIGRWRDSDGKFPVDVTGTLPAGMEKPYGVPGDVAEHFKLMTDLITVAFRADLTRVVTFLVTPEGT